MPTQTLSHPAPDPAVDVVALPDTIAALPLPEPAPEPVQQRPAKRNIYAESLEWASDTRWPLAWKV